MRGALTTAAEIAFWWVAALGLWLLTLSSADVADLIVATPVALGCAVLAVAARHALAADWRYPRHTVAWYARLPVAVAVDTVTVLSLPWRKIVGRLPEEGRLMRVPVAPGSDAQASTRRAVAVVLVSLTPGSYALHADDDTGELLVHSLGGGGRWSMTEVVRR